MAHQPPHTLTLVRHYGQRHRVRRLFATAAVLLAPLAAGLPARGVPGATPPGSVRATEADQRAFAAPLAPIAVVADFAPPAQPWGAGHRGVDLAAVAGQSISAPASGVVTFSGMVAGRPVVTLTHDDGLRSSFEPATGAPAGTRVGAHEEVAVVAPSSSHCAPRLCLHWGVRQGDVYIDPLQFGANARAILLPWREPDA